MSENTLKNVLNKPITKGENVFQAPGSVAIGNVELGDFVSIWFGAVLRGDTDEIKIGERTNIQDNAVIHADPGDPCIIGTDCVIGHSAIVHGAKISHHVLVGMHATILNNAEIGEYCIIGANSLIPSGMKIPPYSLVLGVPGKVVKNFGAEVEETIQNNVDEYVKRAATYIEYYAS